MQFISLFLRDINRQCVEQQKSSRRFLNLGHYISFTLATHTLG